ncbi:cytochrome c551 [Psychrobacillus vulpis]|uniref:Cytochrome c n=1 Tax=Psychrobacillus vulpis TaxID=2325572 RepID=A0A544TS40_9BACI|nr:cytochrome c [Psychrobacillus vulpis]TQR20261.1 cytochrome c [Psychrobacillus vulpis]
MKKKLLAVLFAAVLMLAACGGAKESKPADTSTDTGTTTTTETASVDPEKIVKAKCTSCHGGNLEGQGSFPALSDVGSRLSNDEILNVIENGRGGMPGGLITGDDAKAVADWLATKK